MTQKQTEQRYQIDVMQLVDRLFAKLERDRKEVNELCSRIADGSVAEDELRAICAALDFEEDAVNV